MKTTKTSSLIFTLLSLVVITFSCTPILPPEVTCSSLPLDQVTFGSTTFNITNKQSLDWGSNSFKIQVTGNNGPTTIYPEMLITDGTSNAVPETGTYSFTTNSYDLLDSTISGHKFMFVVSYTGLYDYYADSTANNSFEITSVNGNNVSGCLIGKVTNGTETHDLKLKFADVPF